LLQNRISRRSICMCVIPFGCWNKPLIQRIKQINSVSLITNSLIKSAYIKANRPNCCLLPKEINKITNNRWKDWRP